MDWTRWLVPKFGLKGKGWANPLSQSGPIFHDAVVEKMTLYRSIACSFFLLTVTIAETVPDAKDAKQAFEKYVKERDLFMFLFRKSNGRKMCSIKMKFPKGSRAAS